MTKTKHIVSLIFLIPVFYCCCNGPKGDITETGNLPVIDPDYSGISIPFNIAPLNFAVKEEGKKYLARFTAGSESFTVKGNTGGIIQIPEKRWKRLLENNKGSQLLLDIYMKDNSDSWIKFRTITDTIEPEPVDPFLSYRILYPGYESWEEISIKQRSLGTFSERSIIENSLTDRNCVNCHSYNNGRTGDFMFHMRGNLAGTYFYSGNNFRKVNLKVPEAKNGAVYPRWHPSGKYVAFSSNKIVQQFHSSLNKKIEVSDLESSLLLYDVAKNELMNVNLADNEMYMDTYPEWSPDGNFMYFCRAVKPGEEFEYNKVFYNLYRVPFDPSTRKFGTAELIFDAAVIKKSASFPRISPDGHFLVFTLHDYGCFPIWHKEADLYSIDLATMQSSGLALNSDFTDSYHSWSSNGRWIVFSSKRIDGLTARPFIAYISENGISGKPFILPQKDPGFYKRFLRSYNIPEFSTLKISVNPGKIGRVARGSALQVKWAEN